MLGLSVDSLLGHEVPQKLARRKPGPKSALDRRIAHIKRLPRKEQEFVLKFLDTVIERAQKAS